MPVANSKTGKVKLQVTIGPQVNDAVERFAKARGLTKSDVVEKALQKVLPDKYYDPNL